MPRIKIKQMDDRVATQGVHFGGKATRRKLEPGEVVDLPEGELFDGIWATGRVELTMDDITRPLDYETVAEAKFCSPSYKPNDPSDERDSQLAREAVAKRLAETQAVRRAPEPEPAPVAPTAAKEPPKSKPRRVSRRAAARQRHDGEQAATG